VCDKTFLLHHTNTLTSDGQLVYHVNAPEHEGVLLLRRQLGLLQRLHHPHQNVLEQVAVLAGVRQVCADEQQSLKVVGFGDLVGGVRSWWLVVGVWWVVLFDLIRLVNVLFPSTTHTPSLSHTSIARTHLNYVARLVRVHHEGAVALDLLRQHRP
jgi:hypothetical protein